MAAVVLPQTASASPAEIHVPTDYPTIQEAIDAADPGDTIIVHNGTYSENVNVNKSLTIQAATGANVTVQAAYINDHVFEVTAGYVNINGFTVTNATGYGMAGIYLGNDVDHCNITNNTALGNYYGIYLYYSSDNTVEGNTANENNMDGIRLDYSSDNTVEGNTANENNMNGIRLEYSNGNTLSGNTANENDSQGIRLYDSSDNTLSDNAVSGVAYGIVLSESSNNNTLSGNTASDNTFGIYLFSASNNTVSGNNTASGNAQYGIFLYYSSNNTVMGNNASDNAQYGIYLLESSGNTIGGNNTASGNDRGIYLYHSSNNTLSGNTAVDNEGIGIYIHYSSGNTISDNIAGNINGTKQGDGIKLVGSENNIIDNNTLNNNTYEGIYFSDSDNNTFLNNTVHDNGHGIRVVDSSGNWFVGNDIRGNYAMEGSGVHLSIIWATVTDNHIMFNNIVNNTDGGSYGVYNNATDIVDATLNWWGNASGPSGIGSGTGDAVSDNVTFEPWLYVSVAGGIAEDITGAQTVVVSGPAGSNTTLTVDTSDDVTVVVALYSGNPHPGEPFPDIPLGKYIDIYASDPGAIEWPVHVEMSYTEDEVAAAGINENTLGLYYWDASANEFQRCSDTGVDTATKTIWADVTEDEAGGLAGTPFTAGGAIPIISYSPSSFNFTATENRANPADQTLEIWNSGTGTLNWSVIDNAPWLSLSPLDGDSTGEHNPVTVSVDISGMTAGSYNATITISASGATNTPQTVPVTLNIGAAPEAAPGGLSIGVIAGIIVGVIAGAVLIFFAVRKWVWKS